MSNKEIPVSIIIPTFNPLNCREVIKSLKKQDYGKIKEIILINGNPSIKLNRKNIDFLKNNNVRLINNKVDLGLCETFNRAIKLSKTETLILSCGDYFPEKKDWLRNVVNKLYSDKNIGLVISKIFWPKEAWKNYDFLTRLFTMRHVGVGSYGGGNYKKEVFEKIGFFDSKRFKFSGEDNDMHERLRNSDFKIDKVDDVVIHLHYQKGGKLLDIFRKEFRYGEANGSIKRKYGLFKKVALFDSHIRASLIILFLIGLFVSLKLSILSISIFFFVAIIQSIIIFLRLKWWLGLLLYPFAGTLILLTQTFGAIYGFIKGKADI